MSQFFDFVALGWIEKYLREEMDSARSCLQSYEREPATQEHLQAALRSVHSATGVLRLCALAPAALLTEEIERVIGQLIDGAIAGEGRKLAMTELAAAIEALPAYLANVRAKREVSAGVIANVINDLRHFGNRPSLPDSLFFNPLIKPGAGVSSTQVMAEDDKLKQFANRAVQLCYQHSKGALKRDHESLKRLYSVGKHATSMLAGSPMEPYFRCYMGLIEALAQPYTHGDEVIVDIFQNTFVFLKSLARNGADAVHEADPAPYIKKMLYYIAQAPRPTTLQLTLRDTFEVHDVDEVRLESSGRLIQEDDLLEALGHTLSQLLQVMEFITSEYRDINSRNSKLVATIVPRLRQISLQLRAIGLETHADTVTAQHAVLLELSQSETSATQAQLLDFGGALVAVRESLEHKLKHGLSAQGDSMGHELDAAIMEQTIRCLTDMKSSINREFSRKDLLKFMVEADTSAAVSIASLRPLHRAAALVGKPELQHTTDSWEQGKLPELVEVLQLADMLLAEIPEHAYAEQAAADMKQVLSVLGLMEDKRREYAVLEACIAYIRESIALGGLVNDAGMTCFAEAIAALEHYMERRTADPLGNADDHLDRAEARARMLDSFVEQRRSAEPVQDNVLEFGFANSTDTITAEDLELGQSKVTEASVSEDVAAAATAPAEFGGLHIVETQTAAVVQPKREDSAGTPSRVDVGWQDALQLWSTATINRSADAPLEDPSVDIDEELVECLVEEARKYLRRLEEALPRFAADLSAEAAIMEIRAIFHTMKGSARTIELNEFGEFMYDLEKVFNALRDGYIVGSEEIVELVTAVSARLPSIIELMLQRVPLYTADFQVPHAIAAAITEKRFEKESFVVSLEAGVGHSTALQDSQVAVSGSDVLSLEVARDPTAVAESGAPYAFGDGVDSPEPQSVSSPESADKAGTANTGINVDELWSTRRAEPILRYLLPLLQRHGGQALTGARAQTLVSALVPAMVELREGDFLTLDESTLAYFLDMPVIEHLASNAVFGLVDNGQGEFFKFPLTREVTDGLQGYLNTLLEADDGLDAEGVESLHEEIKDFVRVALGLSEIQPMEHAPGSGIEASQLSDYELPSASEVSPDPKPLADNEPGENPGAEAASSLQLLEDELDTGLDAAADAEIEAQVEVEAEADLMQLFGLDLDLATQAEPGSEPLVQIETRPVDTPGASSEAGATEPDVLQDASEQAEIGELELPSEPGQGPESPSQPEAAGVVAPVLRQPVFLPIAEPAAAIVSAPAPAARVVEDIDQELLDLFIETFPEYLETIDTAVAQLADGQAEALQRIKNTLHTVKGGANSVGVSAFGTLVHNFESLLDDLEYAGDISCEDSLQKIYSRVDEMQEATRFIRRFRTDWNPEKAAQIDHRKQDMKDSQDSDALFDGSLDEDGDAAIHRVDSLRVSTSKIDRLLDTGLEISMSNVRSRHALDAAQQDGMEVQNLARRVQTLVDKLSLQLDTEIQAKTESAPQAQHFDPLEMDRITEKQSLAAILREAAYDLHEEATEVGSNINTAMREAVSLARLIEGSQSEMRLLRLVNFSKLGPGFRRLVHQLSHQLNKQVEFEITCDDGGLDVGVFEQVKTALEHMLRNSLDHGIDEPAERVRCGKSETGKISLIIFRQASEFVIQLLDDGKGLDPALLRQKALEHGLVKEAADLSDEDALRLIFRSGLSTASEVTDVSGRGVGMDVVYQSISQVGGTIEVQSKPGFYTQFDIRIPASIMVNGALLASIGDEQVAVPLTSLDGSDFRHRDEIHRSSRGDDGCLSFRGEEYKLRYLGAVRGTLAPPKIDAMPEFVPVLFARHERRRFAFYVDAVANAEELVIRSLGAQFTGVPGVAGGSLKSDGQPVLALDLNELIRQVDYSDEKSFSGTVEGEANTVILCVDDSVMMRRTYEKRLQSLGYEVVTAVDGEAALDYLSETTRLPDFIFTDLEMPNMNGFDFIANLRRAPVLEDIPTVVVSSRDGEKHRDEAQRVGANDFMAKGANTAEGMRAMIDRHLSKTALAS
jgi:chemotaxis protein histidine kinase CheA/ActR/RegA family two-component response regulator